MNIGLIDVDGHNFPNLCLMKLSAYHKAQGDTVEWWDGFAHYDRVYMSRVLDDTYTADCYDPCNADEVIRGGTGYDLQNRLPDEIEHMMPDYGLYGITDTAYGFLTRGCPRGCSFCIVAEKEGRQSVKVADLSGFWTGQPHIKLLDPNITACPDRLDLLGQLADSGAWVDFTQGLDARLLEADVIDAINRVRVKQIHFAWDDMRQSDAVLRGLQLYADRATRKPHGSYAGVYVLTGYDTTIDDDLYRIYTLRDLGFDPYVMVYNKPTAPRQIRRLQRWTNNKIAFRAVARFEDFDVRRA